MDLENQRYGRNKVSMQEISSKIYTIYIGKYIDMGYNEFEAQLMTLEKLKENYAIEFWKVQFL